jgi:hypothetical protein
MRGPNFLLNAPKTTICALFTFFYCFKSLHFLLF